MVAAMGVSRTVVREAVAALRADGLVVTRQGAGAFVAPDAERRPFRLALDGLPSIGAVLEIMELRASVEVEAAGLAASRGGAPAGSPSPRRDRHCVGARRACDPRGFRVSPRHCRGDRQPAISTFPRVSRPVHHPAPKHPGRSPSAGRPARLSRNLPAGACRDLRCDRRGRRCGRARGDAATPWQQPGALSAARRRAGRRRTRQNFPQRVSRGRCYSLVRESINQNASDWSQLGRGRSW